MADRLTSEEKITLLRLGREALENGVNGRAIPPVDTAGLTARLKENGASFVTLTRRGDLRGCIGALEPYQPLYEDVREHAVAAALQDYRFPPVEPAELAHIHMEISRLTMPEPLAYENPEDLLEKLRPGIDGVILRQGRHRATFLPQVWEKVPDKSQFLGQLCYKMGAPMDEWRRSHLEVLIYQVEEFHEKEDK